MTKGLAGTLLAILVVGLTVYADPMIEVDSEVHDFGTVVEGYAIEHTFVLSNAGNEILVIDRIRAVCGCTTTALATNELRPGESVDLRAVVSSSGFGGRTINKAIYVYSNDPRYALDQPGTGGKLTLYVRGTVLQAQPHHIAPDDLQYYYLPLIDVRSEGDYASGHLVGAVNLPAQRILDEADRLPQGSTLVLYDATGATVDPLTQSLINEGLFATYLAGGLAGWVEAFGALYLTPTPSDLDFGAPQTGTAGLSYAPTLLHRDFMVLVDVRTPEAYRAGHLMGALNLPAAEFDVAALVRMIGTLPKELPLTFYDANGTQADAIAQTLRGQGYSQAKSLLGGLAEWQRVFGDDLMWVAP